MDLTSIARAKRNQTTRGTVTGTSLDRYLLSEATSDLQILQYWKVHEHLMPGLAQMAKDVLAIPIAGVGVERIFSVARQVCSYQRNGLDADTIKQLMIVRTHDQLLATDALEDNRHATALKQKMGFSKKNNAVADAQRIQERSPASRAAESNSPVSTNTHGPLSKRNRKGTGRRAR
jgi:hypothetical protein